MHQVAGGTDPHEAALLVRASALADAVQDDRAQLLADQVRLQRRGGHRVHTDPRRGPAALAHDDHHSLGDHHTDPAQVISVRPAVSAVS